MSESTNPLQDLLDFKYTTAIYQIMLSNEDYEIDISDNLQAFEKYQTSQQQLLDYLDEDTEEVKKSVSDMTAKLDPNNIIKDPKKIISIWNRLHRIDLYSPLEFKADELNLVIPGFENEIYKLHSGSNFLYAAFQIMFRLSLSPRSLLGRELSPTIEPIDQQQEVNLPLSEGQSDDQSNRHQTTESSNARQGSAGRSGGQIKPSEQSLIKLHTRNNMLSGYIGLYFPVSDNSKLEFTLQTISFRQIKKAAQIGMSDPLSVEIKDKNEKSNVKFFLMNVLDPTIRFLRKILSTDVDQEEKIDLTIKDLSFQIIPDIIISLAKEGRRIRIPIELKDNIQVTYERFNEINILNKRNIPFIYDISQLFRECVALNHRAGFLSDAINTYYIQFTLPHHLDVLGNIGPYQVYRIPYNLTVVRSNKEFIQCLLTSYYLPNSSIQDYMLGKGLFDKLQYILVGESFVTQFHNDLKGIITDLNKTKGIRTRSHTRGYGYVNTDLQSSQVVADPSTSFKQSNAELLLKTKEIYDVRFHFETLGGLFGKIKILEVFGGMKQDSNNAVVLKVLYKKSHCIVKIYDPNYSKSLIRQGYRYHDTMNECTRSFVKECGAYHLLQQESFIPKVFEVGTLTSGKGSFMQKFPFDEILDKKKLNLQGYYIILQFIEAKTLGELDSRRRLFCSDVIKEKLAIIHSHEVSHGDIYKNNILVEDRFKNGTLYVDKKLIKVYYIDFGSSRISKKREEGKKVAIATSLEGIKKAQERDVVLLNKLLGIEYDSRKRHAEEMNSSNLNPIEE
ncbi:hypothetical protein DFJ63DRAFT_314281 [Scheffersomyces coipomensis]|uniref:uncharacterized protein n=1 Tax=Scheffersomyces coipomensis TaxID=1788519 RepID=UPI00315C90F4